MPIRLEPVDSVEVLTLMDNSTDLTLDSTDLVHRARFGPGTVPAPLSVSGVTPDVFVSEHGFSCLVTVRKGDTTTRILFDAGLTPGGLVENMRRLEIDPREIEVIVLSHNHWDHITGLNGVVQAMGRLNLPVYIHPEFWIPRRLTIQGGEPIELPVMSRTALEGAGFEITEEQQPSYLFDGSVLITGQIERTTPFERGFPPQQSLVGGEWVPDPLVLDEQALVLNVAGKGLMVLSGCGHAGIINTVRHAQRLTGIQAVHSIIGGFHLGGSAMAPNIAPTVAAMVDLSPRVVVPAHCTGPAAKQALTTAMPGAVIPNSVGSRFTLR
jgi:7,8-dihydropterin-6-yl-methyl-4-(beta-D-ribofuranosyl)aminobenzene 5'-phosphate synthase